MLMTTDLKMKTTAIGSLPHHNVDAALGFSFNLDIPFLPQIPMRNSWEYMIPQALEGLPGLEMDDSGTVTLNVDAWHSGAHALNQRLDRAFELNNYEPFEPTPATSSCWKPFLWELEERQIKVAKVQIAGPLTTQWGLRLNDGSNIDRYPDISSQILRLVLARTLAMTQRLRQSDVTPLLFLDEPALYVLTTQDPRHLLALQELRILIQVLRKNHVTVGLHCCSDTDWSQALSLGLDILSLDAALSLNSLLKHGAALRTFISNGSRLSLGVIPTNLPTNLVDASSESSPSDSLEIFSRILATFAQHPEHRSEDVRKTLTESLFTPACGLALQTTSEAELILSALKDFKTSCSRYLEKGNDQGQDKGYKR